jgi:methylglutaconyl-CoA hydratase
MTKLEIERDGRGVATVALARPEKHNAMDAEMIAGLTEAFEELGADDAVRVIVLTGRGRSFCAGGDLGWMREQMAADATARAAAARTLARMLGTVDACPKPVIGAAQGNALGGGVGLLAVCDVALAADHAKLGLTETKLGMIPATIGPYVIARMGQGMARRVFMSSRLFDAAEGVRLGLLADAVPAGELAARVEAEVLPYLSVAPGAVAESKALARTLGGAPDERQVEDSIATLVRRWETEEAREGISAFLEKRPAPWVAE